jgi:hypothetical protein
MKWNKYFFTICFAFIASQSFAQGTLGVKGGLTFNTIKSHLSSENLNGWEAGLYSKARISDKFYFQPEIDYAIRGGKMSFGDSSFTVTMQTVNVRFIGIYNITEWFYVGAGPYFSYVLSAKENIEYVKPSYFSPFAVGLNFTAAFEIGLFTIALRYDDGLTLITRDADPEIEGNLLHDSKTRSLEVMLAVGF